LRQRQILGEHFRRRNAEHGFDCRATLAVAGRTLPASSADMAELSKLDC
jgi:hypothetical protein